MSRARRRAADEAGRIPYDPEPLGIGRARGAVADYYRRRGAELSPDRVALTASTSEAYGWLAKLLADPSGEILVPTPSYPLFEHLMRLECVELHRYPYRFDGRWHLDVGQLHRGLEDARNPRAIVAVSPNNPTGHLLEEPELEAVVDLCAEHRIPLIVDEVFVDFGLDVRDPTPILARDGARANLPLVVALSGLSKTAALPGAKLGWMAVAGDRAVAAEAMTRIAFVADQYLSASTSSQLLATEVIGELDDFHAAVEGRTRENLAELRRRFQTLDACEVYPAEAGWYAVIRTPNVLDPATFALELVERRDLLVQPGFLYDFRPGHFVVSLLPEAGEFRRGSERLATALERRID